MKSWNLLVLVILFIACHKPGEKVEVSELTGDTDIDFATEAISKNTSNPDLYFKRAELFYDRTNYDRAIEDLKSAMVIDSLNPNYYHLLADVYLDYYQSKRALYTMEQVVKMYPERIPSLLKLCEFQYILKQYDKSISTINRIIKYDRENADAYLMLGLNFKEQEQFTQAINSFQTAVEMDPELTDAWLILGEMYANNGSKLAEQYYDNAINIDPTNIQALHTKAFYLQNNNRIEEAMDLYNRIKSIDRSYADAYLNSGILLLEQDSLQRAWEEFDIITQVQPNSYLAFYYRGIANEMMGKKEAAITDYQNAINLNSKFQKAAEALEAIQAATVN